MSTSKLTGAFCAAGALFLAGCNTTTAIPTVTRLPAQAVVVQSDNAPWNAGTGYLVSFDADKSDLNSVDVAMLDEAALWLQAGTSRCIVVDAEIPAEAGRAERRLARARIRTVVSHVEGKHVPRTRIHHGGLRRGLAEDSVLLREDPRCTDGEDGGIWSEAGPGRDPMASLDPAAAFAISPGSSSGPEQGAPSRGASSPSSDTATTPSGSGSQSGGASGGTGSTGTEGPSSGAPDGGSSGGSQNAGSNGQGSGTSQSGSGQGPSSGSQGPNGGGGNGVSANTPAADRTDAGRGNGSESGDPGQSGAHNRGGDE